MLLIWITWVWTQISFHNAFFLVYGIFDLFLDHNIFTCGTWLKWIPPLSNCDFVTCIHISEWSYEKRIQSTQCLSCHGEHLIRYYILSPFLYRRSSLYKSFSYFFSSSKISSIYIHLRKIILTVGFQIQN